MHLQRPSHPWDTIFGTVAVVVLTTIFILTIPAMAVLAVLGIIAAVKPAFLLKNGKR